MTEKRGRVSMADLMTPKTALEKVERPDAPYELDDEETAEWRAQVASMPADHFTRSTFPLLVALCRHTVAANRLKQLEAKITKPGKGKSFDMRAYIEIRKLQGLETAHINRCLRAMRLTQQAIIKAESLGRKLGRQITQSPWGDVEDDDEE